MAVVPPHIMVTPADEHLLALTVWGEARGLGEREMARVGRVVLSRAIQRHTNIAGVVWAKHQFSCWRAHDPNRVKMRSLAYMTNPQDVRVWGLAKQVAHKLVVRLSKKPKDFGQFSNTPTSFRTIKGKMVYTGYTRYTGYTSSIGARKKVVALPHTHRI